MSFRHDTKAIKEKVKVILNKVELLEQAELLPSGREDMKRYLIDDIRALARDIANDSTDNC
jgi:hypothetical protein